MSKADVVFLFDVDNTLLDNDRVAVDLQAHLKKTVGAVAEQRYWVLFEEVRHELGYADYLGALQKYRVENPRETQLLDISSFLLNYPFGERLFPGALEVVAKARRWGTTVILSDGDVVFQPHKIECSGISAAVDDKVLIYIHKEQEIEDVEYRYPAKHYVLFDDKLRILTAMKEIWGTRLTTVFPKQGHYARNSENLKKYPPADLSIERIGDLLEVDFETLVAVASSC
jgi:hypothetical protein